MAQATWYPEGALQSSRELERVFTVCRETHEDLVVFTTFSHYSINRDVEIVGIEKLELPYQTVMFSDKNIYNCPKNEGSRRLLNFHKFNLLGRGGPMIDYAFLNYWHAYAYAQRKNNDPDTAFKRIQRGHPTP